MMDEIPNLGPLIPDISPMTPTELAGQITRKLKEIGGGVVEGEVTGLRASTAGHRYFTLADENAGVRCTCFRGTWTEALYQPVDGERVQVFFEKIDYYAPHQTTGLVVEDIRPSGTGDILRRIQETKDRLRAEGVRNPYPIPRFPRLIGLITGSQAAATSDVVEGARSRFPKARFAFRSATVQGVRCVPEVIDRMAELARCPEVDVIVIARGGGSLEDLAPFSDERLCRAIAAIGRPVVVAIGHEDDNPACYLTASASAPVPHKVGAVVVPDLADLQLELSTHLTVFTRAEARITGELLQRVDQASRSLAGRGDLESERLRLSLLDARIDQQVDAYLSSRERHLAAGSATLHRHSDLALRDLADRTRRIELTGRSLLGRTRRNLERAVGGLTLRSSLLDARDWLRRGFALVRKADGSVISRAGAVAAGEALVIELAGGMLEARVESVQLEKSEEESSAGLERES
jgi:exodeoxyribonuclease VII large subunit